jgi:hypothetical protein
MAASTSIRRVRLPAEKQEGSPRPAKRDSRSGCHRGSTRAPNARTRRSAARAAKGAQGRAQAEDHLRLLAGKMAKVLRWRASQEVWTTHMRDRNSDAAPPSVPSYPAQPTAAPPAHRLVSDAGAGHSRQGEPRRSTPPCCRIAAAGKRVALARTPPPAAAPLSPPPAESRKKVRGGLQAALAAAAPPAAAPQPLTATSKTAPHRRAAPSRSPTLPSPRPAPPPPALPTPASPRPETSVLAAQSARKHECRPPQG